MPAADRASAQDGAGAPVAVRSGNHPDFARLVFVYPERRRWSLVPTDGGWRLEIEGAESFALSGIFDLIPRDRIGDVVPQPDGSLAIAVTCECHADAVELPGRGLVLDILDGPAPPGNPFELLRIADAAAEALPPPDLAPPDLPPSESPPSDPQPSDPPQAEPLPPPATTPDLRFDPAVTEVGKRPDAPWTERLLAQAAAPGGSDATGQDGDTVTVRAPAADPPTGAAPEAPSGPSAAPDQATALPADATSDLGSDLPDPPETADLGEPDPAGADGPPARAGDGNTPATTDAEPSGSGELAPPADIPTVVDVADATPPPEPRRDPSPTGAPAEPDDRAADDRRAGRWLEVPLVVDAPPDTSSAPEPAAEAGPPATGRQDRNPPDLEVGPADGATVALPPFSRDLADLLPLRVAPPTPVPSAEDQATAAAFGDLLARQIGRGIAQGVVEAAVAPDAVTLPDPAALSSEPAAAEATVAPEAAPVTPAAGPANPLDQIEVRTAVDRVLSDQGRPVPSDRSSPVCLADEAVDPASWIPEGEVQPDFATARTAILGEFDRVDPEKLAASVRYMIAYGFGAEARQMLDAFAQPSPIPAETADVLRAMASIVDGESGGAAAVMASQLACPSPAALWGALAQPSLPRDADYDPAAILRGFEALPTGLRRSLGPDLASRFLEIGDDDLVAALRRSIARIDLPDDAASELAREAGTLLDARVEAAGGREDVSEQRLAEVARLDGPLAPEAVADLLESVLARGGVPDDALVASATAMATELRGSPIAPRLRRAEILAHVARENFDLAYAELGRAVEREELAEDGAAELASAYLAGLTARASDRMFLDRGPREFPVLGDLGAATDARIAAADRMVALGLPEMAVPLVDEIAEEAAARKVAARAWLRLGNPGTALTRLAGLSGEDVLRLRADAYAALGDQGSAADVLDALGDGEAAAAAAWRGGDLDRVARDPSAPRAAIAGLSVGDLPQAPETTQSLAEHADLLAEIARRRALIAAELAGGAAAPQP
jgi:hypothetical protein